MGAEDFDVEVGEDGVVRLVNGRPAVKEIIVQEITVGTYEILTNEEGNDNNI